MGKAVSKEIVWENGMPKLVRREVVTKQAFDALMPIVLALPYTSRQDEDGRDLPEDAEFRGMTNAEVMWIRRSREAANGDFESMKFITERLLGKPKQEVASLQVKATLQDYLASIALPDNPPEVLDLTDPALRISTSLMTEGAAQNKIKVSKYAHLVDDL